MNRILVIGGAGFIGSHLVDALIDQGEKVIVIDNLSTGVFNQINKKAKFYKMDITNQEIIHVFEKERPEIVVHLAAQSKVDTSIHNPLLDANINILGTVNLLNASQKTLVKRFIYASSAAVYGIPEYLGIDEFHAINPRSFYGISKYTPEQYIKIYSDLYDLDYMILRYSNVYGPRQSYFGEGGVVVNFLKKLLRGEQPIIYGNGEQTRDFIYVQDVIKANMLAIIFGKNKILNIGTGKRISINELFTQIAKMTGIAQVPIYTKNRVGDIKDSYFQIDLAKSVLGWQAKFTLEEGLAETIRYYEKAFKVKKMDNNGKDRL